MLTIDTGLLILRTIDKRVLIGERPYKCDALLLQWLCAAEHKIMRMMSFSSTPNRTWSEYDSVVYVEQV